MGHQRDAVLVAAQPLALIQASDRPAHDLGKPIYQVEQRDSRAILGAELEREIQPIDLRFLLADARGTFPPCYRTGGARCARRGQLTNVAHAAT